MAFANGLLYFRGEREDDGTDHIESDTPSDRATPQPDPSDKRLPGIMHNSYFGQVGSGSSTSPPSSGPSSELLQTPAVRPDTESPASSSSPREESVDDYVLLSVAPDLLEETAGGHNHGGEEALPFLAHERPELPQPSTQPGGLHPYPTPPVSQTPSLYQLKLSDASSEDNEHGASKASLTHRRSISGAVSSISRRGSFARRSSLNPLSSIVTTSNVHAAHFSNPSDRHHTSTPSTPFVPHAEPDFLHESPSIELLKRLTDDAPRKKSIPATPTRASSNTAASDASGASDPSQERNGRAHTGEVTAAQTSVATAATESVKSPKGKLTVKISGARGLRRSKDPYVVAVFQRNELVSSGPRDEDLDEADDSTSSPMGGIPIMRSGSDSGRAMAIPMKSRQSSNNSSSDHRDFKGRQPTSNPKWDTEAVL
jgi:hypothetical protein